MAKILVASVLMGLLVYSLFSVSMMKKSWEAQSSSPFECGFTSYFLSRFSFSVHYFLVGLIFLFLDLELSFLLPFFNGDLASFKLWLLLTIFIFSLLGGLAVEWREGSLDWCF